MPCITLSYFMISVNDILLMKASGVFMKALGGNSNFELIIFLR